MAPTRLHCCCVVAVTSTALGVVPPALLVACAGLVVTVTDGETLAVAEVVPEVEREAVEEEDVVTDGLREGVSEPEGVTLGVREEDGVLDKLLPTLRLIVVEEDGVTDTDAEGDRVAVTETEGDAEALVEPLGLADVEGVTEGVTEGVREREEVKEVEGLGEGHTRRPEVTTMLSRAAKLTPRPSARVMDTLAVGPRWAVSQDSARATSGTWDRPQRLVVPTPRLAADRTSTTRPSTATVTVEEGLQESMAIKSKARDRTSWAGSPTITRHAVMLPPNRP